MGWVYIIRGASGRYYIGSTENPKRRMAEHRRGSNHTTKRLGYPLKLMGVAQFPSLTEARQTERRLKRLKNPHLALASLAELSVRQSSPE